MERIYWHEAGGEFYFASEAKALLRVPQTENDLIGTAWRKYLHYRSWFRRDLAEFINDVLVDARTRQVPFWNSSFLESLASDHIRGCKNYVLELNAVLTLEAAARLLLRDAGTARHVPDGGSVLTSATSTDG